MNSTLTLDAGLSIGDTIDLVEEMRLRTWARRNYVAACERDETWHAVILDEMTRIDVELRGE